MALTSPKPASYEDLFDLPENLVGEIVNGRLVTHPRAPRHVRASSSLGFTLGGAYDRGVGSPGDRWLLDLPELRLNADIVVPDLAGWRRSRMPKLPDTAWFELAPDWVCEILSPATARIDRVEKLPIYAGHGVQHAWLVDPDLRTLEVFENREGKWLLLTVLENDAGVCQPPFDDITFSLGGLWAD